MSQNNGMSISRLIQSSAQVKGYGVWHGNLKNKKFGSIYAYNKRVKVKPESSVIEVSMLIESATEKKSNKGVHKVMLAIAGVKQQEVTADELVAIIRLNNFYSDEKKYDKDTLIKMALTNQEHKYSNRDSQDSLIPNSTVFESDNIGKYVIVDNSISDSARIQVWCSCSSYYWVFQYYNMKAGVNITSDGTIKSIGAYRYKTEKGFKAFQKGRPMRNPNQRPGLCKHLMLLIAMLIDTGTIERHSKNTIALTTNLNLSRLKYNERITDTEYGRLQRAFNKDMKEINNERKFNAMSGEIAKSQRASNGNKYSPRGVIF